MNPDLGTIVVVEDDPHIADLVDLYLRRDGFRVLIATNGDQALELARRERLQGAPGRERGAGAVPDRS